MERLLRLNADFCVAIIRPQRTLPIIIEALAFLLKALSCCIPAFFDLLLALQEAALKLFCQGLVLQTLALIDLAAHRVPDEHAFLGLIEPVLQLLVVLLQSALLA